MKYILATEAKQRMAAILDAAQSEPVTIRKQNRDAAFSLSPKEYERLRGLNIQEFEQFCERVGQKAVKAGLTQEKLNDMLAD